MSSVAIKDDIDSSSSWIEWTTRLQTYKEWLNLQLKKDVNNRTITDLRHDLQDGVVVAQLIEALGGERVVGIDFQPTSPASRKENVERIFQHFINKHVPISYCRAKDVLAGDLKCIMRLIHAVASHYRPETVLNPDQAAPKSYHSRCGSSSLPITDDRSKTLSLMIRQKSDTSSPVRRMVGGSALPIRKQPVGCPKLTSTLSSLSLDHKKSPLRKSFTSLTCERLSKCGNRSSTKDAKVSCKVAPLQYTSTIPSVHSSIIAGSKLTKKANVSRSQPCSLDSVDNSSTDPPEDLKKKKKTCTCRGLNCYDIDNLLLQVQEAKEQLLFLQQLLLHGNAGKFLKDDNFAPYGSSDDVTLPRKVQDSTQNDTVNRRLKVSEPTSMTCGDRKNTNIDGTFKSTVKDTSGILEGDFREENENLRKTIEEKEQEIKKLKATLSNQVPTFENKMKYHYSLSTRTQREELQVVHEALTSLRKCFPANDPYQHTLDTIEQSLSALLERVNSLEIGAIPPRSPPKIPGVASATVHRAHFVPSNDTLRRPSSKLAGFCTSRQDLKNCTKVVYYMDKSVTPFRSVLSKKIGEATLRDFKLLFDRPGQYRYHFKTLDPEFGMVKEEVLHDEDVLPGWDGKIIAWIEEDCS